MERVAILVDVQNVYYTTRKAFGCNFDYNAFWHDGSGTKYFRVLADSGFEQDHRQSRRLCN